MTLAAGARPAHGSPFEPDPAVAARMAGLARDVGQAVERDLATILAEPITDARAGSTIPATTARELCGRHGLANLRELALLALPLGQAMARPPISGFRVGAVGIEAGTDDLLLGANLEFPGTDLGTTVHAEGFVALRARRRGSSLTTLAVREAHPCAHCRQMLAESVAAEELAIVDPLGHDLRLADLAPWPFRPAALGMPADGAIAVPWPRVAFVAAPGTGTGLPPDVAAELLAAASRAHAPYSGAPSAVVLRVHEGGHDGGGHDGGGGGRLVSAGCLESVAFNPTTSATQAALVEVAALGLEPTSIRAAWLGWSAGGLLDPRPGFAALLGAVAPGAPTQVVALRPGDRAG